MHSSQTTSGGDVHEDVLEGLLLAPHAVDVDPRTGELHAISHRFCPTCGIEAYALGEKDGEAVVAVNVNCLDGVDPRALDSYHYDGAAV